MSRFVLALSIVVAGCGHALAQNTPPPSAPPPTQLPAVAVPVMPMQVPAPTTAPPRAVTPVPMAAPAPAIVPVTPGVLLQTPSARPSVVTPQPIMPPPGSSPSRTDQRTAPPPPRTQTPKPAQGVALVPKGTGSVPANVKIELTISDTFGSTATRKTVMMLVADRNTGRVRSSNSVQVGDAFRNITINVDAVPEVHGESVIVSLTLEYTPDVSAATRQANGPLPASVHESIAVVLANGKPAVISQSADPATDRKVTVEVTATVVK